MRYVISGCGLAAVALLAGCNTFGFLRPNQQNEAGVMPSYVPAKEDLVYYLDRNSQRVQTLRCDELSLTCSQGIQSAAGGRSRLAELHA